MKKGCKTPGCDRGWINHQHPLKPQGVTMFSTPCPDCNPEHVVMTTEELLKGRTPEELAALPGLDKEALEESIRKGQEDRDAAEPFLRGSGRISGWRFRASGVIR